MIMAEQMQNDQQQQQQNQLQPYGVSFGTRSKARSRQDLPYVPVNIGAHNIRARKLPARPVREQQDVMLPHQHMIQHTQRLFGSIFLDRIRGHHFKEGSSKMERAKIEGWSVWNCKTISISMGRHFWFGMACKRGHATAQTSSNDCNIFPIDFFAHVCGVYLVYHLSQVAFSMRLCFYVTTGLCDVKSTQ